MFEEARGVELHERLRTGRRGLFTPAYLVAALAGVGHPALGWPDAGVIGSGARADLVTVALDSVRTAGSRPEAAVFAATGADVRHVLVDGREVVRDGRHLLVPEPARDLAAAIAGVLP
jgi:cytosine/adenosine deaminase-related metal-dependent hydrolase